MAGLDPAIHVEARYPLPSWILKGKIREGDTIKITADKYGLS